MLNKWRLLTLMLTIVLTLIFACIALFSIKDPTIRKQTRLSSIDYSTASSSLDDSSDSRSDPVSTVTSSHNIDTLLQVKKQSGINVWQKWLSVSLSNQYKKIKLTMLMDGREIFDIVFNVSGLQLGHRNWMNPKLLIRSSYKDLTQSSSYNFFSVYGHITKLVTRRFFINKSYPGGCQLDEGWIFVMDTDHPLLTCPYETYLMHSKVRMKTTKQMLPQFLFCPPPTFCTWSKGRKQADEFRIYGIFN